MIYGTHHFSNMAAAFSYYCSKGFTRASVMDKIESGEIRIGRPDLKNGERCILNRAEGRYFIESPR